jgi:hypothetical protein
MKALYALIVFVVLAGWYSFARADAVAVANIEGVKITLLMRSAN